MKTIIVAVLLIAAWAEILNGVLRWWTTSPSDIAAIIFGVAAIIVGAMIKIELQIKGKK